MEKMNDSEILARLIYRAYISPDPHAPLDKEALLPFQLALDFYARTWRGEILSAVPEACIARGKDSLTEPPGDLQPTEPAAADEAKTATDAFFGYGGREKREIHARLMEFVTANGVGARRRIAEASDGILTLSEIQNMTDAIPTPLRKWRAAAEALDRIEEQEESQKE